MTDELARMRERLATRVVAAHRIGSEHVAAALHAVPRHLFLPEQEPEAAYRDDAIVTKRDETGQPISSSSQPAIMAIMLDQLDLARGQRVLEIGAGTGYNAALISHIVGPSGQVTGAAGFGPGAAQLAADLAAHVQAWGAAGRPGIAGLHVDAYPRSLAPWFSGDPGRVGDALIMERPGTRFAVYHD